MLKKILLSSLLFVAASNLVFAYGAPYIGVSAGVTANTIVNVTPFNYNKSSYRGIPFSIFAGYGAVITSNLYLGGEVTGTAGTIELNNNGLKTSYGYGASLLPGFLLCDHTMIYLRLGILSARFPSVVNNDGQTGNSSTGGQVGLGLQTSLTQNVDLRFEYDYIAYRTIASTTATPRADQFVLAAVYKFD